MSTEKFKSPTIFELQQELLRTRKELLLKQAQWKQERTLLLQKNDLAIMQLNQVKEMSSNLKKINQTLTLAQFEKKIDTTLQDLNQIRENVDKKSERQMRYELQEQYRLRESKLRQKFDQELEEELEKQEIMLRKKFHSELSKLQTQNQYLRTQAYDLQSQISFSHSEINKLRNELSLATNSMNSFRSSTSDKFLNFINNSKQTSSHDLNTSNIVSKMLCEVCGDVFTTNEFFDHVQECEREEQENYEDLLNRKRQIENQLQMLEYERPSKPSKIIMIVNQKHKQKRNRERSFVKSFKSSPSNSFIQNNLKSSIKSRY